MRKRKREEEKKEENVDGNGEDLIRWLMREKVDVERNECWCFDEEKLFQMREKGWQNCDQQIPRDS